MDQAFRDAITAGYALEEPSILAIMTTAAGLFAGTNIDASSC